MNHSLKLILLVLILQVFGSCSEDRLELTNPNQVTATTFWSTEDDIASGVVACYDILSSVYMHGHYMNMLLDLVSDESRPNWNKSNEWPILALFVGDANQNTHLMVWFACYMGIFRCNQVLGHIDNVAMSDDARKIYKGQVYFLRAYYYYYLVTLWRHVPLITTQLETFDDYFNEQAPEIDVYNQVVADLLMAKDYLPWEYSDGDASKGRATKGAAIGFLGKTYMLRACHLNESDKWALAEQELLNLIPDADLGGNAESLYRLFDSYGTDYESNCRANGNLADENNYESIFEIQNEASYGSQNHSAYDAWSLDEAASTKASLRGIYFAPIGFGWSDVYPSAFVEKIFQQEKDKDGNTDPRMGATMTYNRPGEVLYGVNFTDWYTIREYRIDYYWKKFLGLDIPGRKDEMDWHSSINQRIMRLAEIYLLIAECLNEQGRTSEAYAYIQKVRDRANIPDLTITRPGMTKQQMRDQICRERVLELCVEGVRWIDLVRWDRYSKNTGENWFSMADTMHARARTEFKAGVHELCPIPQGEIDANPNIIQNYGW